MSLSGRNGTLTFSTDFLSTTTQDYVVVADWNAPAKGSYLTLDLYPAGISAIDDSGSQTIYGDVDRVQHSRNNKGGGGRARNSDIGGDVPLGRATTTGGTNDGGEEIGNDPNYFWPTAHTGPWNNGAYAYDQVDGTYADTATHLATSTFSDHGFSVPGSNDIKGVEVKLEASYVGTPDGYDLDAQLSWDGGTSWTTAKTVSSLTTTDTVYTLGSPSDTWGRAWSASDFTNTNFRVQLIGKDYGSGIDIQVDAIQVRVYHQSSGGGAGSGGDI